MKLISVDKRKPDQEVTILALIKPDREDLEPYYYLTSYTDNPFPTETAVWRDGFWLDDSISHKWGMITHWMPLPQPPGSDEVEDGIDQEKKVMMNVLRELRLQIEALERRADAMEHNLALRPYRGQP